MPIQLRLLVALLALLTLLAARHLHRQQVAGTTHTRLVPPGSLPTSSKLPSSKPSRRPLQRIW